ncbi:conserved hypothetical protein [Cupriavidus taiwanensis]|nr:conserved hypothetical protein [Cupriavidus taiwanensis]SOY80471.1 conserved hypothetical protein [Cupriavidus taiwanensis]
MFSYVGEHLFEAAALVLTCSAGLSYAVGRSFLDGWAVVAGAPSLLYRADFYDTILAGVQLHSVWRTAAIVIVLAMAYLWTIIVVPDWWNGRISSIRRRRRWQDGWDHLGVRVRFALEAKRARRGVPPRDRSEIPEVRRWQMLGRRGLRRTVRSAIPKKAETRPRLVTLVFVLTFSVASSATGTYLLIQWFLLKPARADGAQNAIKAYVAVTGHVPYQFEREVTDAIRTALPEWACEGRQILSQYRSVTLLDDGVEDALESKRPPEGGDSPENEKRASSTYYVLQGADKTFVLLGSKGSVIRSFGDGPFSLPESSIRPLSALAENCGAKG